MVISRPFFRAELVPGGRSPVYPDGESTFLGGIPIVSVRLISPTHLMQLRLMNLKVGRDCTTTLPLFCS